MSFDEPTIHTHKQYHQQQYLAKPGARPYCSAQPQGVSLPDYESWCPFVVGNNEEEEEGDQSALREYHAPKLPASFWQKHGPRRGCSVVQESNEPIAANAY